MDGWIDEWGIGGISVNKIAATGVRGEIEKQFRIIWLVSRRSCFDVQSICCLRSTETCKLLAEYMFYDPRGSVIEQRVAASTVSFAPLILCCAANNWTPRTNETNKTQRGDCKNKIQPPLLCGRSIVNQKRTRFSNLGVFGWHFSSFFFIKKKNYCNDLIYVR